MSILVDLNQVMISNLMVQLGSHKNAEVDVNTLRHMVLNTLRFNRKKFFPQYGELIICADDKNYWRRKSFPYYKASRKQSREDSELDWHSIFEALGNIREDLRTHFPYKVIQIPTAEADDIIATIVHDQGEIVSNGDNKILILSGDKDFIQLHKYANIDQYDPTRKRWIRHSYPDDYLKDHIIRGDKSDGVPNILSADNVFVLGERQRVLTKKRMKDLQEINTYDSQTMRNWQRNKMMIDLTQVPEDIQQQVMDQYNQPNEKDRSQLFNYFIKNKLKYLMENINEF